jgi:integrase
MSRIVYRITDEYALILRKGSTVLYLEWREGGQKVGRSTGHRSLEPAKQRAREIILETAEIRDADPNDIPLMAVLDRYRLQRGDALASKVTIKRSHALWAEFWAQRPVSAASVTEQERFVAWLRGNGYSEGYVRRVLTDGKSALNRAYKRGEVRAVPFVELPPIGDGFPHYASREQLVAFLNLPMPAHVWTYVLIRLNTACRGDAARDLRPAQVDWQARLIRLNPAGRVQTKKFRPVVPLTDTLAALFDAHEGDGPYVAWHGNAVSSIKTTWRKLRMAAGLPDWFNPKAIRHTVGTELRKRGVPGWDVSGQLGHKKGESAPTTENYAKFDPAYLAKARKAFDKWMADLAKDVPRLRGVIAGSVKRKATPGKSTKSRDIAGS